MSGYFGTEMQQRLQAQAEASVDFINATPGACQSGRLMGCDDPDQLGWERIEEFLDRDGIYGFRMIPAAEAEKLRSRLTRWNFRFDTWDVFLADRASALAASNAILLRGLPDGLADLDTPTEPEDEYTARIQALMGASRHCAVLWLVPRRGHGAGDDCRRRRSERDHCGGRAWLPAAQRPQCISPPCLGRTCGGGGVAAGEGPRKLHQRANDRQCVPRPRRHTCL